jgi:hypothetical protein
VREAFRLREWPLTFFRPDDIECRLAGAEIALVELAARHGAVFKPAAGWPDRSNADRVPLTSCPALLCEPSRLRPQPALASGGETAIVKGPFMTAIKKHKGAGDWRWWIHRQPPGRKTGGAWRDVRALVHYNALGAAGWLDTSPRRNDMQVVAGDITDRDSVRQAVRIARWFSIWPRSLPSHILTKPRNRTSDQCAGHAECAPGSARSGRAPRGSHLYQRGLWDGPLCAD